MGVIFPSFTPPAQHTARPSFSACHYPLVLATGVYSAPSAPATTQPDRPTHPHPNPCWLAEKHSQLDAKLRANTRFGVASNLTVLILGHAVRGGTFHAVACRLGAVM